MVCAIELRGEHAGPAFLHRGAFPDGGGAPGPATEARVEPGMGAPVLISFHEDIVFHVSSGGELFPVGELRNEAASGALANRVSAMKSTKTRSFGEICRLDGQ